MIQSFGLILEVSLIFFLAYLLVVLPPLVEVILNGISKTMYDKTHSEIFKILMNADQLKDSNIDNTIYDIVCIHFPADYLLFSFLRCYQLSMCLTEVSHLLFLDS